MKFKKYVRTNIAEMADWEEGMDLTGVSISDADRKNGSPLPGDKIAQNPENNKDRWLVAEKYFNANFKPYEE